MRGGREGERVAGMGKKREVLKYLSLCPAVVAESLSMDVMTRTHPDLNWGPADLQSAALTTELRTRLVTISLRALSSILARMEGAFLLRDCCSCLLWPLGRMVLAAPANKHTRFAQA